MVRLQTFKSTSEDRKKARKRLENRVDKGEDSEYYNELLDNYSRFQLKKDENEKLRWYNYKK